MIKIPFLTLIIFFVLVCVYHMHFSNAQYQVPPYMGEPLEQNIVTNTMAEPPFIHHKKRLSLFYRNRQRNTL
jgi:hypothetical protein